LDDASQRRVALQLLNNVENILLNGTQLILNEVFRLVGFDALQDKIQPISVEHTRNILGGHIGLVFYDVTTLYFESNYSKFEKI
jgi:hypothetical protein